MAVEVPVILGVATLVSVPLVAPYLDTYRRQFVNGKKYPGANLGLLSSNTRVNLEETAKTHVRYLLEQAERNLYISSRRLSAPVWGHDLAQGLQDALKGRPQLRVHLLTGPELVGLEDGTHPFYEGYGNLVDQDRIRLAVYEGTLSLEGVLSDYNNVYRVYRGLQTREDELVPALWTYRDYDSASSLLEQTGRFSMEFHSLWQKANPNSRPTIKAA